MSAYSHRGHVYFAACGKYVKIGYTAQSVERRIAALPGKLRVPDDFDPADTIWLLRKLPGCVMRDERRLHDLFGAYHAQGEWFHMTPALLNQLEALQYVTYTDELLNLRRARADLRRSGWRAYASKRHGISTRPGVAIPYVWQDHDTG